MSARFKRPIVIDGDVISVKQHETFKDRIDVEVEVTVGAPFNNLVITLRFVL